MESFDIDILPLGSRSDLLWSLGPYNPGCYKFSVSRTPEKIKSDVFESRRVQYIIEKVRVTQLISNVTQNITCMRVRYVLLLEIKLISINLLTV